MEMQMEMHKEMQMEIQKVSFFFLLLVLVCQPDDVKALGKILVKDDGFCCNQFLQEVN